MESILAKLVNLFNNSYGTEIGDKGKIHLIDDNMDKIRKITNQGKFSTGQDYSSDAMKLALRNLLYYDQMQRLGLKVPPKGSILPYSNLK